MLESYRERAWPAAQCRGFCSLSSHAYWGLLKAFLSIAMFFFAFLLLVGSGHSADTRRMRTWAAKVSFAHFVQCRHAEQSRPWKAAENEFGLQRSVVVCAHVSSLAYWGLLEAFLSIAPFSAFDRVCFKSCLFGGDDDHAWRLQFLVWNNDLVMARKLACAETAVPEHMKGKPSWHRCTPGS